MSYWIALFVAVIGNVCSNAALKTFMQTTEFESSWSSVFTAASKPSLWIGLTSAVTLLLCYLYAIRGLPLSIAYTSATALSIIGVTCAGIFLFGETVPLRAVIGIVIIMFGLTLVTSA